MSRISSLFEGNSTVLYLDFVKDVEDVTSILKQVTDKVGMYTGEMSIADQKLADRRFLHGEISVLVATESMN